MFPRFVDDGINVLLQKVTVLCQPIGGCSDPTQIIITAAVALLDGGAGIVIFLPFCACACERNIRSRHGDECVRLSMPLAAEGPSSISTERHRLFRKANPTGDIAVFIDLWHKERQHRYGTGEQIVAIASGHAVWPLHSRQVGKFDFALFDGGAVRKHRMAARRRRNSLSHPFIESCQQRSLSPAVIERIVSELLRLNLGRRSRSRTVFRARQ
jgi:hypothetical protein